jgi:hypothetical protein
MINSETAKIIIETIILKAIDFFFNKYKYDFLATKKLATKMHTKAIIINISVYFIAFQQYK